MKLHSRISTRIGLFLCLPLVLMAPTARAELDTQQILDDTDITVGYSFQNHWRRQMSQKNGLKPEFSGYRMSSGRHMIDTQVTYQDDYALHLQLGQADLTTHSTEGETTEFAEELLTGLGFTWLLPDPVAENTRVRLGLFYRMFSPSDETTTSEAKGAINSGGDVSIDWSELELSATAVVQEDDLCFEFGLHYLDVAASQDRAFPGTTVASDFESDAAVGVHLGVLYTVKEWTYHFRATFIDESLFGFGVAYGF